MSLFTHFLFDLIHDLDTFDTFISLVIDPFMVIPAAKVMFVRNGW